MAKPKPINHFGRVKEARELLRQKAQEILKMYLDTIMEARAAGEYEVAAESLKWLLEHMPEDEGERLLDISVDKPKQLDKGQSGPKVQIGIALGGLSKPVLPEVTVTEAKEIDE